MRAFSFSLFLRLPQFDLTLFGLFASFFSFFLGFRVFSFFALLAFVVFSFEFFHETSEDSAFSTD